MNMNRGKIRALCVAGALALSMLTAACGHRHYKVYDAYYNDYHPWNDHEAVFYEQWARETHRDPSRDFRRLPSDEQEDTGSGGISMAITSGTRSRN